MLRVRGSQESVPYLEVGTTEVYVRTNVEHIETDEFVGWEYDEEVISIQEYIDRLRAKVADQDDAIDDLVIALLGMV
jgi:hypothetical protein